MSGLIKAGVEALEDRDIAVFPERERASQTERKPRGEGAILRCSDDTTFYAGIGNIDVGKRLPGRLVLYGESYRARSALVGVAELGAELILDAGDGLVERGKGSVAPDVGLEQEAEGIAFAVERFGRAQLDESREAEVVDEIVALHADRKDIYNALFRLADLPVAVQVEIGVPEIEIEEAHLNIAY